MKKIFLFIFLLTSILIGSAFFYALPQTKQKILNDLSGLGYKHPTIENIAITFSGFSIDKINLDTDGFNYIENLSVKLFWPYFLTKKDINAITIKKINLVSVANNLGTTLSYRSKFDLSKLSEISKKIEVQNIIWDTATPQSAIRIEARGTVERKEDKNVITASVHAAQHELSFNSNWTGHFDNQKNIELEGTLEQLNINYIPLHLHRGTGWFSYQQSETETSLSAQLDSGSGKLFKIPVNNISLTVGKNNDYYPIIFRAQASGIKNVSFTSDFNYSPDIKKRAFDSTVKIADFSAFIQYLNNLGIMKKTLKSKDNKQTNISLTYMPEKHFADGPLPFDLKIKQNLEDALTGTFLLYTDSMDVRGTAQGKKNFLETLKTLNIMNDKNISEDGLHVDGKLKYLMRQSN